MDPALPALPARSAPLSPPGLPVDYNAPFAPFFRHPLQDRLVSPHCAACSTTSLNFYLPRFNLAFQTPDYGITSLPDSIGHLPTPTPTPRPMLTRACGGISPHLAVSTGSTNKLVLT